MSSGSIQRAQFNMGKIWQVSLILLMSIAISNVLAFLLWPSSAIDDLRQLMVTCFDDFSEKLGGITHSFLQGSFDDINTKYASIENSHRAVFGLLQKHLQEAKYEHYFRGTEKQFHQMKLLVESMQRLAQNIGGLRSAAHTQFLLLKEIRERESGAIPMNFASRLEDPSDAGRLFTPPSRTSDYLPFDDDTISVAESHVTGSESGTGLDSAATPLAVLDVFMYHLGPPMVRVTHSPLQLFFD
jgi:hypothetical protein